MLLATLTTHGLRQLVLLSLEYDKTLEQNLPVLHISKIKETDAPDNPYVYRVF